VHRQEARDDALSEASAHDDSIVFAIYQYKGLRNWRYYIIGEQ
jgi:hypothetical protein